MDRVCIDMKVTKYYIVPLTEKWYIDPEEGQLPAGAVRVCRPEGFHGPAYSSSLHIAEMIGHTSQGFSCAVEHIRPVADKARIKEYYKIQSLQWLGARHNQVSIPIWIARNVDSAWIEHLRQAISDINYAAPGLRLFITSDESAERKIEIFGTREGSCYTRGDMLLRYFGYPECKIYLDWGWPEKKRTSCHELLHALGFGHEHQRRDRDSSIQVQCEESEENSQYCKKDDLLGITRFDPHSILMYPEEQALLRNTDDPVWFTKPTTEINREMSELDKVSLNNLYRPCKGPRYSPTKFGKGVTGLWYCGRYFGVQHTGHDGYCGPTNGPNCPACRVLRSDRVVYLWKKGKWQGWTGAVYCGRWFGRQDPGHDGYCGPNNGPSCPECYDELLKR